MQLTRFSQKLIIDSLNNFFKYQTVLGKDDSYVMDHYRYSPYSMGIRTSFCYWRRIHTYPLSCCACLGCYSADEREKAVIIWYQITVK